jgi:GDSL-like Lipase/Acylhydrolase family
MAMGDLGMRKRGWFVGGFLTLLGFGSGVGFGAVPTARATALSYVALGDSYTSGDGIAPASATAPADCNQSAADYPHQIATSEGWQLTDVSCAGAKSANMTTAQYADQVPQLGAVTSASNIVSVGIGGNDNNLFVSALVDCGVADVLDFLNIGAPCKALYGNRFVNDVSSDASTVSGVIQGVHARAPHARVFVVGYPDILPQGGHCYPTMPLTTGDVSYLNSLEEHLNAMLKSDANANHASFVDTFAQSVGHDACRPSSVRWVNPLIAGGGGISVHPNPAGATEMGMALRSAIRTMGLR